MRTAKQTASTEALPRTRAAIYARVSSKEQEIEGYSIPAQLRLLEEYAEAKGFMVLRRFVDVETAKRAGRANFGEMVRWLKAHSTSRVILVEKTDRLYRNLRDWVTIDELDVEIHLVKEGEVLCSDSRSSEKFMHGIKVLMAKNYIEVLSEEVKKGMLEKAEQGIWPTGAPLGYRNVGDATGKRIIEPDPEVAQLVTSMFQWYAVGNISLLDLTKKAQQAGFSYTSGKPVPKSTIHEVLRNPLYMGVIEWKGERYRGIHQPLVTRELWQRVQDILDGRHTSKLRRAKHDFAFSRLITCGHCGYSVVGEIKKKRYIYYRCTRYKGECNEPYVREEVLEEKFTALLGRLTFDSEVLDWIRNALQQSHADERREHEAAIQRLRTEYDRLQNRIHGAYIDKLDGIINTVLYENMAAEWKTEQDRIVHDIDLHQCADRSYLEEGALLIELARNAQRLFEKQEAREKRRLLNFLVSNCIWGNGELSVTLRQPFDLIARTADVGTQKKAAGEDSSGLFENWLPGPDSNQRPIG